MYGEGQMPSFRYTVLNEGPYAVQIVSGPSSEGTWASCTFEVFDLKWKKEYIQYK